MLISFVLKTKKQPSGKSYTAFLRAYHAAYQELLIHNSPILSVTLLPRHFVDKCQLLYRFPRTAVRNHQAGVLRQQKRVLPQLWRLVSESQGSEVGSSGGSAGRGSGRSPAPVFSSARTPIPRASAPSSGVVSPVSSVAKLPSSYEGTGHRVSAHSSRTAS